jgi:hypothetical protein
MVGRQDDEKIEKFEKFDEFDPFEEFDWVDEEGDFDWWELKAWWQADQEIAPKCRVEC